MVREMSEHGREGGLGAGDAVEAALLIAYADGRVAAPAELARRWFHARFRVIIPPCFDLAALRDLFAPEDLAVLGDDLAAVSAARDLARERTLRCWPSGALVVARVASLRRRGAVATLLLRDAAPPRCFTAA